MELNFKHPVDIVENITPEEFKANYLNPEIPVILRGLWKDYPATTKWTIQFFKKELGSIKVGVYDETKEHPDRSIKEAALTMKFADYLDTLSEEDSKLRLFLFNIFRHKPELKKDFDYPPITNMYLKKLPFMFFGGKNSVVRLHQDMDWSNVFLTQLHGRKKVILFPPEYSKYLYRLPFNVHSPVNPERPDFERYPALQFVHGYNCIIEPGDTLFMPSGYWHHIRYLEGGYAINQRAISHNMSHLMRGVMNVSILSNLDDLLIKALGNSWSQYKTNLSVVRANEAIKMMQKI
jgi:hypothetical protein